MGWACRCSPAGRARLRHGPARSSCAQTVRWENLKLAFRASIAVSGKHILLVDDIMTSKATAH